MAIEETKIGDFSTPLVKAPMVNSSKAQGGPTTQERLDGAERRLDLEAKDTESKLSPLKAYEESLKEAGLTREQASDIIDGVLMRGFYEETIPVTKRVMLILRTRTARDTRRIQEFLEVVKPVYDAHYQEVLARMSFAASLVQFGADKFEHPSRKASGAEVEQAFQNRLAAVEALPDPTLRILFNKLWKFDQKVRVALEEGAIENF